MARRASTQPTDVELEILRILWQHGPSTVRQVHDELSASRETLYATTVKMLLVMLEKGLVKRDDAIRPQVYTAARSQAFTQRRMLKELIQKAYDGSAKSLVMQALSSSRPSKEDLDEIRRMIDEIS